MHSDEVTTLGGLLDAARRISIAEARRRGQSQPDAEDTAQTITIRLWQTIKQRKKVKSVEAWVRRTTANFVISVQERFEKVIREQSNVE